MSDERNSNQLNASEVAPAAASEETPAAAPEVPPEAGSEGRPEDADDSLFLDLPEESPAPPAAPEDAAAEGGGTETVGAAGEETVAKAADASGERRTDLKWYVIHANTGHENKVKRNIEMAIKSNHMEDYFGEILVATQEVTEMKNGKRSTVRRKFFPSYVLVEMVMSKETHHFINSIPGVTRFVGGTPLKPAPITKEEVDRILGRISSPQDAKTVLEIPYEIGDSVQVIDGPFTDWIGVINEINHDKGKLKVMISIFGSETPVELDFLQVKAV
jgi:transcriptional antiterminator NusG